MAATALQASSDATLSRCMPADMLAALQVWLREALEQTEAHVNKDLADVVACSLDVLRRVPPQIQRILASKLGLIITALRDPKKSKSALNKDASVVKAATELRDAWGAAQLAQKASGQLPGDMTRAEVAAAAAGAEAAAAAVAAAAAAAKAAAAAAPPPPPPLPPPAAAGGGGGDSSSSSSSAGAKRKAQEPAAAAGGAAGEEEVAKPASSKRSKKEEGSGKERDGKEKDKEKKASKRDREKEKTRGGGGSSSSESECGEGLILFCVLCILCGAGRGTGGAEGILGRLFLGGVVLLSPFQKRGGGGSGSTFCDPFAPPLRKLLGE